MQASTWLERVQDSLRENGIPEPKQRQFLAELQDHLTDLQEANMNPTEPLDLAQSVGSPEPLARALAESYRSERFLARHRWLACLAFAVGPLALHAVLSLFLCFMALAALFVLTQPSKGRVPPPDFAVSSDLGDEPASKPSAEQRPAAEALLGIVEAAFPILFGITSTLCGVGVTAWFCMAARRNRLSWRFSLLGCLTAGLGTPALASDMFESRLSFWVAAIFPMATMLTIWYLSAWHNGRWKDEPISLSRRYPAMMSGGGSLVAAWCCVAGYLILVVLLLGALELTPWFPEIREHLWPLLLSSRFVPFAGAAYLCWRMTARCPRRNVYSFASCLCLALAAALFFADISKSPEGQFNFRLGVGLGMHFGWTALAQFLTPLAVWGALMLLTRRTVRTQLAA